MGVSRRGGGWLAVALLAGYLAGAVGPAWSGEPIPWKEGAMFEGTFQGASLEALIGSILRNNGMEVIFPAPGLKETADMQFDPTPLRGAFERVVQTFGLDYRVNGKQVTVMKRQSEGLNFYTPKWMRSSQLQGALQEYGLLGPEVKVVLSSETGTFMFKGPQSQLDKILGACKTLDEAYEGRAKSQMEIEKSSLENESRRLDLDHKIAQQQRARSSDSSNRIMEVIRLKYASVGASTVSFQGQDVQVPGIIDSLKTLVGGVKVKGEEEKGGAGKETVVVLNRQAEGFAPGFEESKPEVAVDARTNSVIVQGSREQVQKIKEVVARLDQPVPLVEIEVMIVEGKIDLSRTLGNSIGYSGPVKQHNEGIGRLQAGGLSLGSVENGIAPGGLIGGDSGLGGLGLSFLSRQSRSALISTLQALAKDGKSQVLASPRVVTLNNRPATINNTDNVSVPVVTVNNGTVGLQTVQGGMGLKITPSVVGDEDANTLPLVRMEIVATKTSPEITGGTIKLTGSNIQTNVVIPEESTFVLGGFFNDTRTEDETGVPLLKDVPILGSLFKNETSVNTKKETVYLITPKVFKHQDIMRAHHHWARDYMRTQKHVLDRSQQEMLPAGFSSLGAAVDEEE